MKPDIRILLVDDHTLVRNGLRTLLQTIDGLRVVGEAEDGHQAVRQALKLTPDMVFMDLTLPKLSGIDAIAAICKAIPQVIVIALTANLQEELVQASLKAGARGYVSKSDGVDVLKIAIDTTSRGQTFLSPTISGQVVAGYLKGPVPVERPNTKFGALTKREHEVLKLVVEGHTTRKIAALLGISMKTVDTHRGNLMKKAGVRNTAALINLAHETGVAGQSRQ